jgi:hypothetical protein
METNRKVWVVLLPSRQVPVLIHQARAVVAGLTGNPDFPSPTPSVATLQAQVDTLDHAQTAVLTRSGTAVPARDAAKTAVESSLRAVRGYVQYVADANPERADAIARSAGMSVKASMGRVTPEIAVRKGAVPGSVVVTAKSLGRHAMYEWAISTDQGHTWTSVPATFVAKTTIVELAIGTSYAFRVRTHSRTGVDGWSSVVTFVVT